MTASDVQPEWRLCELSRSSKAPSRTNACNRNDSSAYVAHTMHAHKALESLPAFAIVSIIIPVRNAAPFLNDCIQSVLEQTTRPLQICAHDDSSSDGSLSLLLQWQRRIAEEHAGVSMVVTSCSACVPATADACQKRRGVGGGRNAAIASSTAEWLCFLDADDVMRPCRIALQLEALYELGAAGRKTIMGGNFSRLPVDATPRYTGFHQSLRSDDLNFMWAVSFRDCPIAMPTWMMHREVYTAAGGFVEGPGVSEDLVFFYQHISRGGIFSKVDEEIMMYRHVASSASFALSKELLMQVRADAFQSIVLPQRGWEKFSIWGCGRDGKRFFNLLSRENKHKVIMFVDVAEDKIARAAYNHGITGLKPTPVLHFSKVQLPVVCCVAFNRQPAGSALSSFEANVASVPGISYGRFGNM